MKKLLVTVCINELPRDKYRQQVRSPITVGACQRLACNDEINNKHPQHIGRSLLHRTADQIR